jgi:chemotaxis protein CheY-P-specific phosphatase CheC
MLVDILNKQEDGTTRILKEIDRSAIKEMLNILSNSYANAIAEASEIELKIDIPSMITVTRLQGIISQAFRFNAGQMEGLSIIFETTLTIANKKIRVGLFLIFNENFAKLCCSI